MADSVGMFPKSHGPLSPSQPTDSTTRPVPLPALPSTSQSIIPSLIESPPELDRVFVHALNTVKKIPKTGASRPPPSDRLRLYGLYKQAMEGDVDGVMERPEQRPGVDADELQRERDKWDAWSAQNGLSRTEAKRRYIEALIETMHHYANTPDGKGLVAELEFVWDQIKNNSPSSSHASPNDGTSAEPRRFQEPLSGTEGPMKVLSPMSEDDAAEHEYRQRESDEDDGEYVKKGDRWSRKVERAVVRLSAEVAALREQITVGREWRSKKERSFKAWISWAIWIISKHLAIDMVVLGIVLLWMRRRKDRRLEDHVRAVLKLGREYARKILPSR
ncbi:acyl-CoA binding protein [Daldinia caldariorum]|uniref:acyl-CoA binding protein n=1 Tax=Daldinia caldariorum TaxID=326644 RepID=UPI002007BCCF|nr:acyl-CoA binding protein [Daldinia caldariorum]KAI1472035.1 acyl-CoA binding protein [Daldinia caldariorum]